MHNLQAPSHIDGHYSNDWNMQSYMVSPFAAAFVTCNMSTITS